MTSSSTQGAKQVLSPRHATSASFIAPHHLSPTLPQRLGPQHPLITNPSGQLSSSSSAHLLSSFRIICGANRYAPRPSTHTSTSLTLPHATSASNTTSAHRYLRRNFTPFFAPRSTSISSPIFEYSSPEAEPLSKRPPAELSPSETSSATVSPGFATLRYRPVRRRKTFSGFEAAAEAEGGCYLEASGG